MGNIIEYRRENLSYFNVKYNMPRMYHSSVSSGDLLSNYGYATRQGNDLYKLAVKIINLLDE